MVGGNSPAIGQFAIGGSPIGGAGGPFDVSQTVLLQYENSPTITNLIKSFSDAVEPTADIGALYASMRNLNTCVGTGLDIWGAIVGVSRILQVTQTPTYFGFHEAMTGLTGAQPFNQAPMYSGSLLTNSYALGDSDFRTLIFAKAAANISNITAPNVNSILRSLFGSSGKAYCLDPGGMAQQYVFEFSPTPVQLAIVTNAIAIPRTAGVQATLTVYPTGLGGGSSTYPIL